MAATVDIRPTITAASFLDVGKAYKLEKEIDFATASNQLAQNETMAIFDIPADVIIERAMIKVLTADTDVTDVNLGISTDGSTDDTLVDGATLGTTGYKLGGTNAVLGQVTAASNQLVLTNIDADTINGAKIEVIVVCRAV